MTTQPTPKGTFPITPETKIPFPCWLWSTGKAAYANGNGWVFIEAPYWKCDIQHTMFTHYSTLPPDQKPENVGDAELLADLKAQGLPILDCTMVTRDEAPSPTLEQLAEKAARDINAMSERLNSDGAYTGISSEEAAAIILRHLSPEWERMVRERDAAIESRNDINRATAETVSFLRDELDTLRAENEQARKEPLRGDMEKNIVGALRSTIAAHGSIIHENAPSAAKRIIGQIKCFGRQERDALRAENERLEEDRARLDWLADPNSPLHRICLFPSWGWKNRVNDKKPCISENLRAAIDAARVRELEEDKARLDVVEKAQRCIMCLHSEAKNRAVWSVTFEDERHTEYDTLREAMDALTADEARLDAQKRTARK